MGDDLRLIDWIAYARSEKLLVKQFDEESAISAYIFLDVSKSMALLAFVDCGGIWGV